jgi:Tfp pilus assembly protein PilE
MKRFKHPFTLVELLCVVIVIALLAAISLKATQLAYRHSDETKTKTIMEIFRVANEQYKAKKGYYLPSGDKSTSFTVSAEKAKTDYCRIKLSDISEFLGDAYEVCNSAPVQPGKDKDSSGNLIVPDGYLRDAWGNELRYRCPGRYNEGTYDLYSIGRDGETNLSSNTNFTSERNNVKKEGFGDDITNFAQPR